MERNKLTRITIPNSGQSSFLSVLHSIFREKEMCGTTGYGEGYVKLKREKFRAFVGKFKGPEPIAIIYKNHSERYQFVEEERKKLKQVPNDPPREKPFIFTFADDVFVNIFIIFCKEYLEGKNKPYLLHNSRAKVIFLSKEFSVEEAFEELLTLKPVIYADDFEVIKKSPYVDQDKSKWDVQEECTNDFQFVIDFSVIYPEDIWSTAVVCCYDCGKVAEVVLCDAVTEAARSEIWDSIAQFDIVKEASEKERHIIRLPPVNCLHSTCSFREGLIGFTSIARYRTMKPSLYVRVRLTFFTNEMSHFGPVIHKRRK